MITEISGACPVASSPARAALSGSGTDEALACIGVSSAGNCFRTLKPQRVANFNSRAAGRLSGGVVLTLDVVLMQLLVEVLALQSGLARRPTNVAAVAPQAFENVVALELITRRTEGFSCRRRCPCRVDAVVQLIGKIHG